MALKKVLLIGEKPSQVKVFADVLFNGGTVEKLAKMIYIRRGVWKNFEITMLPLHGHITTIDTADGFGWGECQPIEIVSNQNALVVKQISPFDRIIKKLAKTVDELWLATDPDAEGDNIAREAYLIAVEANPRLKTHVRRLWNSSLTKSEVLRAFNDLREWDERLALGVQGRRITDAWVGFAGTREITFAAREVARLYNQRIEVLSVGRVQLPLLKLIVDRDEERKNFKPTDLWHVRAHVSPETEKKNFFEVTHEKSPFPKKEETDALLKKLQAEKTALLIDLKEKTVSTKPPTPLNTTDALSLLALRLKIKADKGMQILSDLYEQGYISYPRTDNRKFKDDFPHESILIQLTTEYEEFKPFLKKIESFQQVRVNGPKMGVEDHDPIFPTGVIPPKKKISKIHFQAWELISRYYISLFMADLKQAKTTVKVTIKDEPFRAVFSRTLDLGWTLAAVWKQPKASVMLPHLEKGQTLHILKLFTVKTQTQPPPRWSDSSIIKKLERLSIGTKSSRPEILKKLELRKYVKREKNFLESTELGKILIKTLNPIWPELTGPQFTAHVENLMDQVAQGQKEYMDMLEQIRNEYIKLHNKLLTKLPKFKEELAEILKQTRQFSKDAQAASKSSKKSKSRAKGTKTKKESSAEHQGDMFRSCPVCSDGTVIFKEIPEKKLRFAGCTNYPDCNFFFPLPRQGKLEFLDETCPKCQSKLILYTKKSQKETRFYICPICQVYCWKCPEISCPIYKKQQNLFNG